MDPRHATRTVRRWESQCGRAVLFHGDSLDLLQDLPEGMCDAVVTDPPYSSGGMFRGDRLVTPRTKYVETAAQHSLATFSGDNRDQRSYLAWTSLWTMAALNCCREGALLAVFTDWRQLPTTTDAVQAGGWLWRGLAVWQKVNGRPMLGRFTNQAEYVVWATAGAREIAGQTAAGWCVHGIDRGSEREHITQKPVPVMEWVIKPTDVGDTILDPFMGSGSTGVAAIRTGRKFVGIEIGLENFEIAKRRISEALEIPIPDEQGRSQQTLFGQNAE